MTGYDTQRHPTIWPTRAQAETVMRPGDTLRVIGQTYVVVPPKKAS
jgi:hypothetical protein